MLGKIRLVSSLLIAIALNSSLQAQSQTQIDFRPITQEMLNDPDPEDWLMWRGGYNNWGYSPLDQINRENVDQLRLAWSWSFAPSALGSNGMQVEPTVYDGIMYIRHSDEKYSAHNAATGDLIWQYSRPLPTEIAAGDTRLTVHRGRGVFIYEDKLISHATDGTLFALNPSTGALLWESVMTDFRSGAQPSGAPVAFGGSVVVPYNCTAWTAADPCHMSAYDADNGDLLWRWYTSPTAQDPMHSTWGDEPQIYPLQRRRNMSPWMTPAVDSERGLFIFGVGSSAPQQPQLAGTNGEWPDRLYQGSTVALDHRTGALVWWAQHHSDMWNDDSVYDRILVDAKLNPSAPNSLGQNPDIDPDQTRELVIGSFSKDAIFYVYDRTDGGFLYARPTAYQNVIRSYDGATGAYTTEPDAIMTAEEGREATICRENRQIPQGAYSPLTNAYYVPAFNGPCSVMSMRSTEPTIETGYNTTYSATVPSPAAQLGQPEAIDVTTGKSLWRLDRETPLYGMLTTGGGLLFAADTNRRFHAIDQWTGETLWQTILNGASDMAPISFAVNGRQFVAVIAPSGTQAAAQHAGQLGLSSLTGLHNVGHTMFVYALH